MNTLLPKPVALLCLCAALLACQPMQVLEENRAPVAATIGGIGLAADSLFKPQLLMGALFAWSLYDPAAPNWEIRAIPIDETSVRFELELRTLITGGEGEARTVFMRSARRFARDGGFAGFYIRRFEEGIGSTRPFAKRYAEGEILLADHADPEDKFLIRP